MRLIILTQYYPPEIGAPQRRLSDLAKRFIDRGHSVTVLTAMPNYPTGRILEGYGGLLRREAIDGVPVIRTFIYPTKSASFVRRMLNYLSFVFSSMLFGVFLLPKADYLLVESPPLFLGVSAYVLSRIKRTRLIFNVSDIWPSGLARLGLVSSKSIPYRLSAWLEAFCYRKSTLVTCQTRGIESEINERFPFVSTYYLTNGIALEDFDSSKSPHEVIRSQLTEEDDEIVLLYAGLHGLAQSLDQILDAAALVQDQPLRFVFMGDGPEKSMLKERAETLELRNVQFLDPQLPSDVPEYLASADVIVVSLKGTYKEAVPSKLFEAMACEKPVLLVASSEACQIVERYNAGVIAEPGNPADIAEKAQLLANDPHLRQQLGTNGRRAVEQFYSRDMIARDFESHLESLGN